MKRDYFKDPLKYGEKIPYDDLYEVYIVKNRPKKELPKWFNCTKDKVKASMKFHKIQKSMELRQQCHENTMMEKYGVKNIFEKTEFIEQKVIEKYGVSNVKKLEWVNEKFTNTCMEKYGVTHISKLPEVREKTIQTNMEKYGGNAPMCSAEIRNKVRNNNLQKYGVSSPMKLQENKDKVSNTKMQKYGTLNPYKVPGAVDKYKRNSRLKYGTDSPNQSEYKKQKCRNTCMEKYGVPYTLQLEEVKQKTKETCLEKYGVEHPVKSIEIQRKIRRTMHKNGSFKDPKTEKYIYAKLQTKFPDVIRQYDEDQRYPFPCDFYIPELDLFIEYQGYKGHGGHPFDKNNPDDLKIISEWEEKSKEINYKGEPKNQYKSFIKCWTQKDPLKRETANKNNLNWIEFFNMKDFNEWFEQQGASFDEIEF